MKIKKVFLGIFLILIGAAIPSYYIFKHMEKKRENLTLFGNVDIRQVDLGFRVFGRVQTLLHDEGDEVKTGDLLAILDKVPYQEALDKAKGELEAALATFKDAEEKWNKRKAALPSAISKEDYDDAFFNFEQKKAVLEIAKASYETAKTNYQDTEILCPTEGTILTRIREPGSVLNPGEPVFTLSIKSPVWIRAYVSEPNLGKIYFGMPAEVITDTKTNPIYQGHIGFISPVAEFTPKNVETLDLRTDLVYRLRIIVDDPDHFLKQGMPVTVHLKTNSQKP